MRFIHLSLKKRLAKAGRQTKWAPFWVSLRKHGLSKGRQTHPSEFTTVKRNWRRNRSRLN